ncbi:3-carboxy-cis,cis-muconate cycloisomerase [Deinococcus sp. YIM 134068]|uniref:3-carboxy-cis,cis-muconate cycloisomerase n=1 Tax=Deinococcus lichenicola TaxID=3118910 RepID=UPI002F93F269
MTFTPLDSTLYAPLFSCPPVAEMFSDTGQLRSMVEVEAALASAQGRLGIIPAEAAEAITRAAQSFQPDLPKLQEGVARDGFPIIALLAQLRAGLPADHAEFVHWGATTQDIMDTALVLALRDALAVMEGSLQLLIEQLSGRADEHRHTLMAGRTHSQQALPITFGLKVAGWLAPLLRHQQRLRELRPRLLVVQFGGAAGTLAALGGDGLRVRAELARELGLGETPLPWHTGRDTLAELAGWLSGVTGSLGKVGQDILLLAQSEVGEVRESGDPSKGGSSTMPQKSNPIGSELLVAAARANAALLSGVHQALVQEHERATHGWQLEWLTLPQMVGLTAASLERAAGLAGEFAVNEARMEENVRQSGGLMLSEAVTFALAGPLGRTAAKALVKEAVAVAMREGRPLVDVVRERTDAPVNWDALTERHYLGVTDEMIDAVLQIATTEGRSP